MNKSTIINILFYSLLLCSISIAQSNKSIEYQLATINAGGYISPTDITVSQFRNLLSELSNKYVEDKQQVADMSVTAVNMLKKDGIDESLMNIMTGLNQLFYKKYENQKYAEYAAMYVSLRGEGYSHQGAIDGLKAILNSMGVY